MWIPMNTEIASLVYFAAGYAVKRASTGFCETVGKIWNTVTVSQIYRSLVPKASPSMAREIPLQAGEGPL